ncbi:MAG: DUF4390 domain-containing protein [Vicinamibacterales bacterium]
MTHLNHRGWTWLLAGVLVAAAAAAAAAQSTVRITPVLADEMVFATFAVPTVFSDDVHEAVQSGIPVTLTFAVELRRSATLWFDKTVGEAEVASTVRFDPLTGAYQVSKLRAGTVHWSQQTQKADEMRQWATEFERVPLESTTAIAERGEYYIRVRARDGLPRGFSLWPFGRDSITVRVEVPAGR